MGKTASAPRETARAIPAELGQIVLVFQGGGALGAYQVGVYEALHDAGIEPDWVIGTSIGAINASIVAGNAREHRMDKLRMFWSRVQHSPLTQAIASLPFFGPALSTWSTIAGGLPNFFSPNMYALAGANVKLGAEAAGYYHTSPLGETLAGLVDFERISGGDVRLTVGAASVRTSEMRYFDSRDTRLDLRHVLASGALPPAFPAIRIDGDLYWDGGILSNTPVEAVFDDYPRRNSVVFAVHIWNPHGPEPETMGQVMNRQKDVQYCSRAASHINRQRQIHRLRHVVSELAAKLPPELRNSEEVRELAGYGCLTQMHVVRVMAPSLPNEDHTKDIDFSPAGVRSRWALGYADTQRVIAQAPWGEPFDPLEGFVLHEAGSGGRP